MHRTAGREDRFYVDVRYTDLDRLAWQRTTIYVDCGVGGSEARGFMVQRTDGSGVAIGEPLAA